MPGIDSETQMALMQERDPLPEPPAVPTNPASQDQQQFAPSPSPSQVISNPAPSQSTLPQTPLSSPGTETSAPPSLNLGDFRPSSQAGDVGENEPATDGLEDISSEEEQVSRTRGKLTYHCL